MLGIVPRGPARLLGLLPLVPYRCVRCGKSNWRLSAAYGALGSRLTLGVAGLAALALAYWLGATLGLPGGQPGFREVTVATRLAVPPEPMEPGPPPQSAPPAAGPVTAAQPAPAAAPGQQAEAAPAPAPAQPARPAPPVETAAPAAGEEAPLPLPVPRQPAAARAANASPAPATAPLRLKDLAVRASGAAVVITARASAPLAEPEAFLLDGPPRFVIDIPGRWTPGSARSLKTGAGIVRGVRTGLREGALRLVLDLAARPAHVPQIALRGDTLTVTLR